MAFPCYFKEIATYRVTVLLISLFDNVYQDRWATITSFSHLDAHLFNADLIRALILFELYCNKSLNYTYLLYIVEQGHCILIGATVPL